MLEHTDMVSYLETADFDKGKYFLVVAVPRSFWMTTSSFDTCLKIKLTIEYMKGVKSDPFSIVAAEPSSEK
jgi:hypothetical protein